MKEKDVPPAAACEADLTLLARGEVRPYYVYDMGRVNTAVDAGLSADESAPEEIILPGCWVETAAPESNLVLYDAATIIAELLRGSPDGKSYNIGAMYLEFENNGGAAVSPPSFDRSGGKSYYDGLSTDPTRDYIRVAITAVTMDSSDTTKYPRGNRLTVYAQTTGTTGVHGKTFSDTVSSRVYGGALVSAPVFADQTQDLVLSRFYFSSSANQLIKTAGAQIGLSWALSLL